jgi:hypothetical protein
MGAGRPFNRDTGRPTPASPAVLPAVIGAGFGVAGAAAAPPGDRRAPPGHGPGRHSVAGRLAVHHPRLGRARCCAP